MWLRRAGRRWVLASCRLPPQSPAIALQTTDLAPAVSSPRLQPSLCEGGKEGLEETFSPAFCLTCSCQQKTPSYFLALGVEKAREKYLAGMLWTDSQC